MCILLSGYVTEILEDAKTYANYAKKSKPIELEDVKLAVQMYADKMVTTPPPRDVSIKSYEYLEM